MENEEKERIKSSFLKVKEDIESLKTQLNELKSLIKELQNLQNFSNKPQEQYNVPSVPQEIISTRNEGVYADIHSFIHSLNTYSTDKQTNTQTQPKNQTNIETNQIWALSNLKQIDSFFLTLTKQEFFTFMVIYQLEEDIKRGVSYLELSRHMSLSEGCIRTYISQMLKKRAPIQKIKLNNKLTLLSINKEFRSLNLKSRLSSLLSKSDPNQSTLI